MLCSSFKLWVYALLDQPVYRLSMVWTKNYKLYTNSSDKEKPNIGTKKLLHDFVEIFNGDHTKNQSLKNCASVENFICNFCTGLGGGGGEWELKQNNERGGCWSFKSRHLLHTLCYTCRLLSSPNIKDLVTSGDKNGREGSLILTAPSPQCICGSSLLTLKVLEVIYM